MGNRNIAYETIKSFVQNKPIVIQDVILNICYLSHITVASTEHMDCDISGPSKHTDIGRSRTKILDVGTKLKRTFFGGKQLILESISLKKKM